jgi:sugar/nucleoside kinase (ribokinase family)
MPDFDLLVLGDVNPDLVLRGGELHPAFGQAERLVEEAQLTIGGSGSIVACGAARLGMRVAMAGVVGDDLFGAYMREELAARGVNTGGISIDARRPTGITVVLSDLDDRAMLTAPGTVGDLRRSSIDPDLLRASAHVHVSSYFLQRALTPDLPGLFAEAHARGATTSVDPNWDPTGEWDGGLMDLLGEVDVFLPNEMEAMRLARISDLDQAVARLGARASMVVVKTGERGAVAAGRGQLVRLPAITGEVMDTVGAGDSFDAGFLTAFVAGSPLEDALALANACGALSARVSGGTDGQPTMEEARAVVAAGSLT